VMCLGIALLGIAIAFLGIARLVSRDAAGALAGTELALGMAITVAVAASFWIAMQLARRKAA